MAGIDSGGNKNFTCMTMKTNGWLILGLMVATSAFAQNNTNVPPDALPPVPAPAISPAPAAASALAPRRHKKHGVATTRGSVIAPTV